MKARCEAIRDKEAVPRTCPVCKLGPCSLIPVTANEVSDSGMAVYAKKMLDERSRQIGRAVDAGEMDEAMRLRDMSVPDFLGQFVKVDKESSE